MPASKCARSISARREAKAEIGVSQASWDMVPGRAALRVPRLFPAAR